MDFRILVFTSDTDSLYIEKNYWDILDKANSVVSNICQGKIDYKSGSIFNRFFWLLKKYCLTIDKHDNFQQHMSFKDFNDSKWLLDRSQYLKMLEGEKVTVMLPKSWMKSFKMVSLYLWK